MGTSFLYLEDSPIKYGISAWHVSQSSAGKLGMYTQPQVNGEINERRASVI
mgnify:CR=1 FL=1